MSVYFDFRSILPLPQAVEKPPGGIQPHLGHKKTTTYVVAAVVTRRGFEPRTHCLKGSCSAN